MKKTVLAITLFPAFVLGQVGINTQNPKAIFHIDGSKDNPSSGTLSALQQKNDVVVTSAGQIGIGTILPEASSVLDMSTINDKGFITPKISLTSNTDQTTITSPATGLMAYNTGAGALSYKGYVFWNGSEWRTLDGKSLKSGTIGSLTCNNVTLTPNSYTAGNAYSGTMEVPYTGGNGGVYPSQTIGPVNGLTATISDGNFTNGSGTLIYSVTGTPTVTSPTTTTFNLSIGGQTCSATVGASDAITLGELVYYRAEVSASGAGWLSDMLAANGSTSLPTLGNKIQLDAYFSGDSNGGNGSVTMYPRIVNITSTPIKIWFSALSTVDRFNAGNYLLAAKPSSGTNKSYVELDNGIYYGVGFNDMYTDPTSTPGRTSGSGNNANQEVETVDIAFDDKWYRVYYFPTVDNKNTTGTSDNTRVIYLSIQRLY
ncbi:hypothetical protein [Chryseobacterium sp. R2ACT005]|uniref:hypothetical protein n=1 Tax=Chryseobacterium sp. R2ACT005 TaxID=3416668 RepID=UPI003CEE738A